MALAITQYPHHIQTLTALTAAELTALTAEFGYDAPATDNDVAGTLAYIIEGDHRMATEMNKPISEVQYGTGWDCCAAKPSKAIVFDCGTKWAVCKPCSRLYPGTVEDLPRY